MSEKVFPKDTKSVKILEKTVKELLLENIEASTIHG